MLEAFGKTVLDTDEEVLAPEHTALVVVDMQNDFGHPDGHFARSGQDVSEIGANVEPVAALVDAARESGALVVWITQNTAHEGRSDSPAWLSFKMRHGVAPQYTLEGTWGAELLEPLEPREGEPVVRKFRSSAFHGTGLADRLRRAGIASVAICGCVTEGCVESTVRDAAFNDFYVTVVEDAVASIDRSCREASLHVMRSQFRVRERSHVLAAWSAAAVAR